MANGITVTQAGVPTTGTASALNIYAEKSPGVRSAFAFANASSQSVTIQFDLVSSEERLNGINSVLNLSGNGQRTLFLDELPGAEALPEAFKGVLRISTTAGAHISAIGLRTRLNERGDFLVPRRPLIWIPPIPRPNSLFRISSMEVDTRRSSFCWAPETQLHRVRRDR